MSRAKNWCFTLNNYNENELESIRKTKDSEICKYIIFGKEVRESGTPHLQGYIGLSCTKRASGVKQLLGSTRVHLEIARGTPKQASEYCKKDGDFEEHGELPGGRGKRSDLDALHDAIKEGATVDEIRNTFYSSYVRYYKCIEKHILDIAEPRTWETEVVVFWGKTGTGKTRQVFEYHDYSAVYIHNGDMWFDGYSGQDVVLFDDYNGSEFKLTYLLRLLDRYPMKVPIKGGFANWKPKIIYMTSNKDPKSEWYINCTQEHKDALMRRIKTVTKFPTQ